MSALAEADATPHGVPPPSRTQPVVVPLAVASSGVAGSATAVPVMAVPDVGSPVVVPVVATGASPAVAVPVEVSSVDAQLPVRLGAREGGGHPAPGTRPRGARRWWRPVLLAVGIAVAAAGLRGHLPDPASTWSALGQSRPGWLLAAIALAVVSMAAFAEQQRRLLAAFGVRMPAGASIAVSYARSAMATALPGGSAVSAGYAFRQFRSHGASQPVAAAVMLLSGVASLAGLAVVYAGDLLAWISPVGRALAIAVAGVAVLILGTARTAGSARARPASEPGRTAALERDSVAVAPLARGWVGERSPGAAPRRWGWVGGRSPGGAPRRWAGRAEAFLARLGATMRRTAVLARSVPPRHWLAVVALATLNWLTDLSCLVVSVHAVGLAVPARTVATAYLAVQLIRQIPATPGGIGVIEASLVLALTTAGATQSPAAAAVLVYRILSSWSILPIGLVCWTTQKGPAPPGAIGSTTPPPVDRSR